jgi:predicted ATP-dependent endonuclease of OLD family
MYREAGSEIPGETLGLGVQSAIVVGIFEAFRQRGGEIGTVLIEESEMYLHPQAQRYFYGLLTELVERGECQVIYSTHSPIFADVTRFEGIRLVRREPGTMAAVNAITEENDIHFLADRRDAQKMLGFTATHGELFFARRALLVEGPGDELAARHVASGLRHDLDAEDLTVVACGGKSGIPFVARLCKALEIPFWVMHDEDLYPEPANQQRAARVREANAQEERTNQEILKAAQDHSRVFVLKPGLEDALGIGRWATDKPRRVAEELQKRSVDGLPDPLCHAVRALVGREDASVG